jgi:hypothetical protein
MRIEVILAAGFGLCLTAVGPAVADGGGGGNERSNTTTCDKGQVWDSKRAVGPVEASEQPNHYRRTGPPSIEIVRLPLPCSGGLCSFDV